jgi:hypothetical protein
MTPRNSRSAAQPAQEAARTQGFGVGAITTQARRMPNRIILHGLPGWGKTSFAAQIPGAVFLMVGQETGLLTLIDAGQVKGDIAHFPEPAQSLGQVHEALRTLREGEHDYRALVIDAITGVEAMIAEQVIHEHMKGDHARAADYGGDMVNRLSVKAWDGIIHQLEALRQRGMGVMLLAHSKVVNFKNPEGPDYERWEALGKHTWARLSGWADIVLFGGFEISTDKKDRRKSDAETKAKAAGGEVRLLWTERKAPFDAKNRHGLPDQVACGASAADAWAAFSAALKQGRGAQ